MVQHKHITDFGNISGFLPDFHHRLVFFRKTDMYLPVKIILTEDVPFVPVQNFSATGSFVLSADLHDRLHTGQSFF